MPTAAMADIAPRLDRAGFEAIDLVGGAVFDVCVRYLREDPWERMRILSGWVRETPLIVHHRGQSLFTFELFPDDVVELTAERIAASGIRYHTTYDALNDVRNLEVPVRSAKANGLHTVAGFVYTASPVHTDEYYAGKIREMVALGVDGVFLKDPSGLLTPERAATLVPAAKRACGALPLQIHSHCLSGLAPYVVVKCIEHGADAVHTATSTLANGASHPSTEQFVHNARRAGFDVEVDLAVVEDVADRLRFIAANEGKPVGEIAPYDEFHYHHQVPGGMISNLKSQLAPLGIEHRLEEILDEAGRVRADLGYPIVVSPFAQFIITQSVLNVMNGSVTPRSRTRCASTCSVTTGKSRDRSIRISSIASRVARSRSRNGRACSRRRRSSDCDRRAGRSHRMTTSCSRRTTTIASMARSRRRAPSRPNTQSARLRC